jgi:hypothetical protein
MRYSLLTLMGLLAIGPNVAMRFTLRDLFWLTIVISLGLTLSVQRQSHERRLGIVSRHAMTLRDSLVQAKQNESVYLDKLATIYGFGPMAVEGELIDIDWELADREIP